MGEPSPWACYHAKSYRVEISRPMDDPSAILEGASLAPVLESKHYDDDLG